MHKRLRWVAVAGMVLALAGCSAKGSSESGTAALSAPEARQAVPNQGQSQDSAGSAQGKPAQEKAPVPAGQPGVADRKLVRTAKLELTAPKVSDVISQVRVVTQAAAGYTGQESTQEKTAMINIIVPADKLDSVLDQLAKLGKQVKREATATDVTEQLVDVESRIATQRASVERIRALLARATSVSEITSVESELTSREAELESLLKRRESLAGSVAMSTISLQVTAEEVAIAKEEEPGGFLGGLAGGWDAFLTFGGGLLTVIGAMAPFLLVFGIPAVALVWWLRKRRRPFGEPALAGASDLPKAPPVE